jgi:hypothetical protein
MADLAQLERKLHSYQVILWYAHTPLGMFIPQIRSHTA